jgi:Glycoside Hydrolase Family 113
MKPPKRHHIVVGLIVSLGSQACTDFGTEPAGSHVPGMKGFCYTSFASNGFTLGGQVDAVGNLKAQINNDWIALSMVDYQNTPSSTDIGPNTTGINPLTGGSWSTTSTDDDIREGVRQARTHGMKVMLKPHVDLYTGEWRGVIHPDSQGNWFRSYTSMMTRYARLASEFNVELLCVGTEFVVATQPTFSISWRAVIDSIKQYYDGRLTYAANWNGAYAAGIAIPEFDQVEFWDRLDYIGIDSYFPLTGSPGDPLPPLAEAIVRMQGAAQSIGAVALRFGKPVIITEVGIQSVQGALARPWDFSLGLVPGALQDNGAQEFYYRVTIDVLGNQQWCAGVFWWNWESIATSTASTNYTPRNKPAAALLRHWYSGNGVEFALGN